MRILLCTLNARFFHVSLALHSLRSNAPDEGTFDIQLREYTINQEIRDILGDIYSQKPDVIGFGVYIWNKAIIFRLAKMIKKIMPEVKIILGGPEVSYDPQEFIDSESWIDAIVLGEGEQSFWQLIESWQSNEDQNILGVAQSSDQSKEHWQYLEIRDLNQLKFAYKKTPDKELENRIVYYESSRGCPFACSYCLSGLDGQVRNRSAEIVKEEIDPLLSKDIRQVKFVDRTFNATPAHFNEIIDHLSKIEKPLNFHFEMDAAILKEETIEQLMKLPTGRVQLEIGIQSTSKATLEAVGRHHAFELESKMISKLKNDTEIHLHLDLIAGLPYEDIETFGRSFNDVFRLSPHQLQLGFLKMLRGSRLRGEAEKYNYQYDEEAPYEIVSNSWLSAGDLHRLRMVEHCLEETWNAGRLQHTLQYLIKNIYNESPFECFLDLSHFLDNFEELTSGRNGKWWVERIAQKLESDDCWEKYQAEIEGFLKLDILLMEKGKWKPEFIQWQDLRRESFWRDEAEVQQHIPEYQFTNWRDVHRRYIIEEFPALVFENNNNTKKQKFIIQLEGLFRWWKIG